MTTADQFVDLSSNNAWPNIAAYANAGHKHICRKVSEGVGYRWYEGEGIVNQAHHLGLHVGSYHWLRPDSSPTAQAAFFVAAVKPTLRAGDWLMCDFERTQGVTDLGDSARAGQLREFTTYVREHLPTYPLFVYTGNWYLDGKPACQAEVRKWPVVMSDYSAAAVLPNPYHLNYVAWQFTDRATVAGCPSPVDYNRWLRNPSPTITGGLSMSDINTILAKLAEIEKKVDVLEARFLGSDGHSHTVESVVAHVAKGLPYLSKKGRIYR